MDSCSNGPATALIESQSVPELTAVSTEESKDLCKLSNEASDVIKQIEMCILDLKRGSRHSPPSENTIVPMHSEAPNELPNMVTDFVPKVESTSIVLAKSLIVTGSEPRQTVLCARCRNDLLSEVENGKCEEIGPQYQQPGQSTGLPTEMELQNLVATQPVYLLLPTKTMASPVSSQTIGSCTGLAAAQYVPTRTGNVSEEIKGQHQMADLVFSQKVNPTVAKIESLSETSSGNCLISTQIDKCNGSWTDGDKISKPLATCLQQEINEKILHQNEMGTENYIIKPGACQTPKLSRVSKDYMNRENIQGIDSRCKVDKTSVSWSKRALPLRINKQCPLLDHKFEDFPALLTSNSQQMDKDRVGVRKTADCKYPPSKIQDQDESEDTSFSSNSSNWTSQQTSMSNSDSEEYYLPSYIRKQKHVSSTSSSENDFYSPHPRRQGYYAGESSSDLTYSWSSSDGSCPVTPNSSDDRLKSSCPSSFSSDQVFPIHYTESEDEDYSVYNQQRVRHHRQPRYLSLGSTSKKFSPARVYKSDKGMTAKKQIGKWKKLKDKLSVIFHHHHHHHHHHHNHSNNDHSSNDEPRMGHGNIWLKNNVKKSSHPMRTEAYGEKALKKLGKSVIHSRDRRHQHNHFNALVGRLFKHIRHSKESKPSAKHKKQIEKGRKEGKKASAKLHWWQLLQRHRKVKKLGLGYDKR
ncbi:uncharacterized protein [Coffea arabica]|uniref:Uncharacterized protein n=1 Tax=Coffea arabica TaxID=13443 RepID=A0A6P6S6S6_COFAR|nr:uncharacterized protein LOC113687804 [Coffea arabica]XP_027061127.1 uncharacterized protein LOC113687804 [Coffea arabica]